MIISKTPSAWYSLKVGDSMCLTNEAACILATDRRGPFPIEGKIKEVLRVDEPTRLATWLFLTLDLPFVVLAKIVGQNVKVCLMRESLYWESLTRSELVKRDNLFIFSPPADLDAWQNGTEATHVAMASSLNFAGFFDRNALAGDGKDWKYVQRSDREFQCSTHFSPARYGADQLATISEYGAEVGGDVDPELVILELGARANGKVRILTGMEMTCDEIFVR